MIVVLYIIQIAILFVLIWQDFKQRHVSLIGLITLLGCNLVIGEKIEKGNEFWNIVLINLMFLCIQFIALQLYFWIKEKRLELFTKSKIGLGDVLFLVSVIFLFQPIHFMIFIISGLLFTLIFSLLLQKRFMLTNVPLVSFLSIWLIVYELIYTMKR